jgi:DNA-binding transcriptional MerR regulator
LLDHNNEITAKELARLTGETYHTIDHWTDMRILKVKRIHGRKRYYDREESTKRCKKIRELQNQKYGLELIGRELERGD